METQTQDLNTKLSAIDKALAAAKARKAVKESSPPPADEAMAPVTIKKSDVDKAAKAAARAEKQAQLKADREARKAAKDAAKSSGKPAHMKKIDRAAGKLPQLNDQMQLTFNEVTTNYSAEQITALALHLQHFNRVKATERALNQKIEAGMSVRIIGGDPKYVGLAGTVNKAQRIRCYVDVPGFRKPVYLFTSDVEISSSSQASTGTDG